MLLISACTAKKTFPAEATLRGGTIHARSVKEYAEKWLVAVSQAPTTCSAKKLYCGTSHAAIRSAQQVSGARLMIVSAGLGLITAEQQVPAYDLTVSLGGPGPFQNSNWCYDPALWWKNITGVSNPVAEAIRREVDCVVLALPADYLAMVADDLESLGDADIRKLRIITTARTKLSPRLMPQALRYDARLGKMLNAKNGSMASLVARSALHFLGHIHGDARLRSVLSQRRMIEEALSAAERSQRAQRRKVPDATVLDALRKMKVSERSTFSSALRTLRDVYELACESSRFKALYVKAGYAPKK